MLAQVEALIVIGAAMGGLIVLLVAGAGLAIWEGSLRLWPEEAWPPEQ